MTRRIHQSAGAILVVGVVFAVSPGYFGWQTGDCGPINCGFVQVIGKLLVCAALLLSMGTVAARAIRARQPTPAALAGVMMVPAFIWAGLTIDGWRATLAGTGEVAQMVTTARVYAASSLGVPQDSLRGLTVDGKPGWAVVKVTAGDSRSEFVILRFTGGVWAPRAIGPAFSRDDLRALGAPVDLMRDAR
ncbi:MAG: hypothetical protein EPO26_05015 [Chloroflexota bacterium]|nr:MAG: hypothetical protein EPO26_05015 [Chloroflexota bacterium]